MNSQGAALQSAKTPRPPQLVEALNELDKAMEQVKNTIHLLREGLHIQDAPPPSPIKGISEVPANIIGERISAIMRFRDDLYVLNSRLEEIQEAVREI